MKQKRKVLTVVLCLALTAASGCNGNAGSTGSTAASTAASTTAASSQNAATGEISLLKDTYSTWVGGAVGIKPISSGEETVDTSSITYTSSDPGIAKVSGSEGCVIGVAEGTATITLTAGDKKMGAKVVVCKSRTDSKLENDFYEYERAEKIKELKNARVTVTEGEEFSGNSLADVNMNKKVLAYADEIMKDLTENGGKSPYGNKNSKDAIASLISTYKEDEDTKVAKMKKDLATFLAPIDKAKTVDELLEQNAKIIADGNWGLWKNNVLPQTVEGSRTEPGCNFILRPNLTEAFELDRKADYDNTAISQPLSALIDGVLEFCGENDAQRKANVPKVLEVLKTLAPEKSRMDVAQMGLDGEKTYEEMVKYGVAGGLFTVDEIAQRVPNIKYKDSLKGFKATGTTKVQDEQMGVFDGLNSFVKTADPDTLRELIKVHVVYPYFTETKKGLDLNDAFLSAKTGAPVENDYDSILVNRLRYAYGWDTANAYINDKLKGTPTETELKTIMDQTIAEFKTAIEGATWMSDETRSAMTKKVGSLGYSLFGPADFTGFVITEDLSTAGEGGSLFTNIYKFNKGKWNALSVFMDKDFLGEECYWKGLYGGTTPDGELSPMITNASYDPGSNYIGIYAGAMDEEFFKPGQTMYNLGRLGFVIAHEIGHGYDLRGLQYDYRGAKSTVITEEDAKKLSDKQSRIIKMFDTFSVLYEPENEKIYYANGAFEISEIMADIAALEIVTSLIKKNYPSTNNLKDAYASIAHLWIAEKYDALTLTQDYHPYGKLRGGASMMMLDEFYETFGIKAGDGMYIAPENRVRVWS
ncbi:MAG: Ig-like domain-containing protein [Lachnospiraceae bacterium]|nr:Ig-like domain-containing protein [Lachnospiraceae bacterium]